MTRKLKAHPNELSKVQAFQVPIYDALHNGEHSDAVSINSEVAQSCVRGAVSVTYDVS